MPEDRHHDVLREKHERGRQCEAGQHGEESGFGLGLIDPSRDAVEAVVSGENQREPEEWEDDAGAFDLVEQAQGDGERQDDGAAAAGGLDEGERYGGRERGQEIDGEGTGGRAEVRLEEDDEDAEEVVDGPYSDVAHVVRSWVRRALGVHEGGAAGFAEVAEQEMNCPIRQGDKENGG